MAENPRFTNGTNNVSSYAQEDPFPQQVQLTLLIVQLSLSATGTILNGLACVLLANCKCCCTHKLTNANANLAGSGAVAKAVASANRSLFFLSICELGYCSCILGITFWSFPRYLYSVSGSHNITPYQQRFREIEFDRKLSQTSKCGKYLLFVGVTVSGAARNWWLSILTCVRAIAVLRPHFYSVFMSRRVLDVSFSVCCLCALLLGGLRFGFQFASLIFPSWQVNESQKKSFNFMQRALRSVLSCVVIVIGSFLIAVHLALQQRIRAKQQRFDATRDSKANGSIAATNDERKDQQTPRGVSMLQKKRQQATVVVLVLAITFSLLETPTVIHSYSSPDSKWHDITNLFLIVNACVNFVILLITKEDFRSGLRLLCMRSNT